MELVVRQAGARRLACAQACSMGKGQLQEFLCELEHVCAVCELSLKPAMVEPGIPIIYDFRGLGELHQLSVPLLLFHLPKGDNLHPD